MVTRLQLYARYFRGLNAGVLLLFAVLCLTLLGLVVLSSATKGYGGQLDFFRKQVVWLVLAVGAGVAASLVNLEWLRRFAWVGYGLCALLLLAVLIPGVGVEVNGARRWLDLGPMRMQVSDFAKLGMLFALAHWYGSHPRTVKTVREGFLVPGVLVGVVGVLVIAQPDFGTAALCGAVGFCLMFLAGTRLIYLIPTALLGLGLFSLMVYRDPIRLARITSFLDVEGNKQDGAWQLWQGMLAFAAGGVKGQGLGNGRQQMSFLPEAHTDFIFPIIGEELGLVFTAAVVFFFVLIFVAGVWSARQAPDLFQSTLVLGALLFVTFQALINIGVVTGCLPTKGMSLPFISYGGSNLVVMYVLVGVILNCFASWEYLRKRTPREIHG